MHYHPVLKTDHIHRGLDDKFLIVIESSDPNYDSAKALLESAGGTEITEIES